MGKWVIYYHDEKCYIDILEEVLKDETIEIITDL